MSLLIPPRSRDDEMIDRPGHADAEVEQALHDIEWVNRNLSGWRALRRCLPRLLSGGRTEFRVLDLGTGSADLPRALCAWARGRGMRLRIVAVDLNPEVLACARRRCAGEPDVSLVRADIFRLPFPPRSFDVVICSLFLHHFDAADAVRLLQVMAENSRGGVLVNDLQRHRIAYWAIWLLARLMGCGRLFRHDAPLSVLRAYRPAELRELLRQAGLEELQVRRTFPFRMAAFGRVA